MPFQDRRFPCLGVKQKIDSWKWLVDNISLSFTAATTQIQINQILKVKMNIF